jgi:von Willebrand factor type A domain-containing protein
MNRVVGLVSGLSLLAACQPSSGISPTRPGQGQGGAGPAPGTAGTGGSSGFQPPPFGAGGASIWPDASAVPPPNKNCGEKTYQLMRSPAELLLVLDRSGSMRMSAPGSLNSKWVDVTSALDETLMKTDSTVLWGLKTFPNLATCTVDDGVLVPSGPGNYLNLSTAIKAQTPDGNGTPTTIALQKAVSYLKTVTSSNPKYLVLATDGEPNCQDGLTPAKTDEIAAVQAVKDAAAAGFPTFVVGIAAGAFANTVLNDMAVAGMQPRAADPRYYPVNTRQDLITALGLITGAVTNCLFPLEHDPPSPDLVTVTVNGAKVARDAAHASGWDFAPGGKSIQLYGAACDEVKKGNNDQVSITFGCPDVP